MLIRRTFAWMIPEREATPQAAYRDRRQVLKALGLPLMLAPFSAGFVPGPALAAWPWTADVEPAGPPDPSSGLYPVGRNGRYALDRAVTAEGEVTEYNNFVEFGSFKRIARYARKMPVRPWTVAIDGLVEQPMTLDIDQLLSRMPLEERLYRHRCVETWAMAVPWSGFPLAALVSLARPLGSAKYVVFQTFQNPAVASGQKQFWYPWPYTEVLTMAEAANELAFLATGLYGKPLPQQSGAPVRLVVPWKYGFKSAKSLVRIAFVEKRPQTFWETVQGDEYGFWANVNPDVPHPRWSQKTERMLGTGERRPTRIYNGYGAEVAHLYTGLEGERLFL